MRTARLFTAGLVLLASFGAQVTADLINDPNGMAGWKGGARFTRQLGSFLTDAEVEYCVYDGAAAFLASFPAAQIDPGQQDHYFYAYQVFNDVNAVADDASRLAVGKDGDEVCTFPTSVANGGVPPNQTDLNVHSVGWDLKDPTVAHPGHSDVLYFTSPFPPGDTSTSHVTGKIAASLVGVLPTPTPEPSTVILVVVGAALVSRRRRGKR